MPLNIIEESAMVTGKKNVHSHKDNIMYENIRTYLNTKNSSEYQNDKIPIFKCMEIAEEFYKENIHELHEAVSNEKTILNNKIEELQQLVLQKDETIDQLTSNENNYINTFINAIIPAAMIMPALATAVGLLYLSCNHDLAAEFNSFIQ